MDTNKLIEELEKAVRKKEEELRRLKDSLAALKGKSDSKGSIRAKRGGFRPGSLPALAFSVLKDVNQPMTLADLVAGIRKHSKSDTVEPRAVSIAISRYIRQGRVFRLTDEGKVALMGD